MKVLIIDDESSVRRALQRAFQARGHQALVAEDAIEGEVKWREELPDAVVLDVLMPKKTGPQLLEQIKDFIKSYSVKVVLISAYSGEFDTKLSKYKGVNLLYRKPLKVYLL